MSQHPHPLPEMPCAEFVERVTDYLEDSLEAHDRARLEEHLGECTACALYVGQLRQTLTLAGQLCQDDVTPDMQDELLTVFTRWRQER